MITRHIHFVGDWAKDDCEACYSVVVNGERQGEHHVGVRFDDARPGSWRITLDGSEVQGRCVEALAGEKGWVLLHEERPRKCPTCWGLVQHLYFGRVAIACSRPIPAAVPQP